MYSHEAALWLQLSLLPHWGPVTLRQLQESSEDRNRVFGALPASLPEDLKNTHQECLAWGSEPGNSLVCLSDDSYPPLLLQIPDPPPVLFVRGSIDVLSLPQIAMVGSRKPSPDGRRHARRFAEALVDCGYAVTSGLALGIDSECHQGAIAGSGKTIAVLGSGLNRIYPARNGKLAREIVDHQGTLVCELPPQSSPQPFNFPRRNRIISGLSHGVLVVEAARRSGSLITARLAGEQGREVFSVPGSIRNPLTQGCHALIRNGAKLVESPKDILEELPAMLSWEQSRGAIHTADTKNTTACAMQDTNAAMVLEHIGHDPVTVDELAMAAGISTGETAAALVLLELKGEIEHHEGRFVLSGN